jgi:hypothetical protein
MSKPIRQRIIEALEAKVAEITTANGYNTGIGATVHMMRKSLHEDEIPGVCIWPGSETVEREYKTEQRTMKIRLIGFMAKSNPADHGAVLDDHEEMFADLLECVLSPKWTLPFTLGTVYQPAAGNTLTGHTSGATGAVESLTITSGTFSGGTAAGSIVLRRIRGVFQAETADVGAYTGVITLGTPIVKQTASQLATGGFAQGIAYVGGGADEYPEGDEQVVACPVDFNIVFQTLVGNPYEQPT